MEHTRRILPAFIIACALLCAGCSRFAPAPLEDGLYLEYRFEAQEFSAIATITFTKTNKRFFEVTVRDPQHILGHPFAKPHKKDGKVMVDRYMKRRDGALFQIEALGPVWVAASEREKGGRRSIDLFFSGETSDEIREWRGVRTYAVTATIFRGAFSGTWYFDTHTGFLVGLEQTNVIQSFFPGSPPCWVLTTTNAGGITLPSAGRAKVKEEPRAAPGEKTAAETAVQAPAETPVETPASDAAQDIRLVYLKNGRKIEGRIVEEAEDSITIELGIGTAVIKRSDIEKIE